MELRVTRKRQQARPGGRAMEVPVQQDFIHTRSTPNCSLGIDPCRVCIRITAETSPKLVSQLAFWDTYLVSPEVHNGTPSTQSIHAEALEQGDEG